MTRRYYKMNFYKNFPGDVSVQLTYTQMRKIRNALDRYITQIKGTKKRTHSPINIFQDVEIEQCQEVLDLIDRTMKQHEEAQTS